MTVLGPNDVLPCPSDSHRRTSIAHGRICVTCEPDAEWAGRCPMCTRTITVVGGRVEPHMLWGVHACSGGGMQVAAPVLVDRPIWSSSLLARDGAA